MKVDKHPILGEQGDKKKITIPFEGEPIEADEGDPWQLHL